MGENSATIPMGRLREFDVHDEWQIYKPRLESYFLANSITEAPIKRAILLNSFSENAYKLIYNLAIPERAEELTYDQIVNLLNSHFKPVRAIFAARHKFYNCYKQVNESANEWAVRIRSLAAACEFTGTELEGAMRDRFIVAYDGGKVQDRLFEEDKTIKFATAIQLANAKEAASKTRTTLSVKEEPAISFVRQQRSQGDARRPVQQQTNRPTSNAGRSPRSQGTCRVCGKRNHVIENCYYREFNCNICNKKGHLASVCTNRSKNNNKQTRKQVNVLEEDQHLFNVNDLFSTPMCLEVLVENISIVFQIDTGASVSAMPETLWKNHFTNMELETSNKQLFGYNGTVICPIGSLKLHVKYNNILKIVQFYVIKDAKVPILGRDFMQLYKLGISQAKHVNLVDKKGELSVTDIIVKYKSIFEPGLGTFNKANIALKLKDENVTPKFFRDRPLPFILKEKVESELDRLKKLGVISQVEFSEWGTPIVPVLKKDGSVRICGDFKVTINPHIEQDKYPLPRIDELFTKLRGGTLFSKLDLSNAYQQVCLDEESKELVTISTHRGLFRYNRLPYGVTSAPAKFQKIMESLLQGLKGVVVFIDDIGVTGENASEHLRNLEKVLERLQSAGLKLSLDKCLFFQNKIKFLGYEIDKVGLHTSKDKIVCVQNAPRPTNVTQLKAFLGLVNYMGKFVKNLSLILHPLYELLKKGTKWLWSKDCEEAFKETKLVLTSTEVLVHFNPELPIKLTIDASEYGIGAIISHVMPNRHEKPIAYASRTLKVNEKNYSQIEKEALAIIFGITKFNQYLQGLEFTIVTDHKPLVAIFAPNKGIPQYSANRLRRWALILSNYSYKIEYIKSKENIADSLSRLPVETDTEIENDIEFDYVNFFTSNEQFAIKFEDIKKETDKDKELIKVRSYVKSGWSSAKVINNLKPYYIRREEMTIEENCLLWNNRIVIPNILRKNMLTRLHDTHMGVVKMKSLARSYFWWPGLDKDIENIVKSCEQCMPFKKSPPKAILNNWPWPEKPWTRIHCDFLGPLFSKYFLIIVDAHSKWLEVFPMSNITANATIEALRSSFARYGLPETLVSDNGTQFTSSDFQNFLKLNNVNHITSPPFNPQSNGAAENAVKTIKLALKKALVKHSKLSLNAALNNFLFDYRTTKHCTTEVSPSFLMLGREIRSRFDLLKPSDNDGKHLSIANRVKVKQSKQSRYFKGTSRKNFSIGDNVIVKDYRVQNKPSWVRGLIMKRIGKGTFLIEVPEVNAIWKRHLNQIQMYIQPTMDRLPIENREETVIVDRVPTVGTTNLSETPGRPKRNRTVPDRLRY